MLGDFINLSLSERVYNSISSDFSSIVINFLIMLDILKNGKIKNKENLFPEDIIRKHIDKVIKLYEVKEKRYNPESKRYSYDELIKYLKQAVKNSLKQETLTYSDFIRNLRTFTSIIFVELQRLNNSDNLSKEEKQFFEKTLTDLQKILESIANKRGISLNIENLKQNIHEIIKIANKKFPYSDFAINIHI